MSGTRGGPRQGPSAPRRAHARAALRPGRRTPRAHTLGRGGHRRPGVAVCVWWLLHSVMAAATSRRRRGCAAVAMPPAAAARYPGRLLLLLRTGRARFVAGILCSKFGAFHAQSKNSITTHPDRAPQMCGG